MLDELRVGHYTSTGCNSIPKKSFYPFYYKKKFKGQLYIYIFVYIYIVWPRSSPTFSGLDLLMQCAEAARPQSAHVLISWTGWQGCTTISQSPWGGQPGPSHTQTLFSELPEHGQTQTPLGRTDASNQVALVYPFEPGRSHSSYGPVVKSPWCKLEQKSHPQSPNSRTPSDELVGTGLL